MTLPTWLAELLFTTQAKHALLCMSRDMTHINSSGDMLSLFPGLTIIEVNHDPHAFRLLPMSRDNAFFQNPLGSGALRVASCSLPAVPRVRSKQISFDS